LNVYKNDHQTTIQLPTSPKVCFYTTRKKQNQQNIAFYLKQLILLIKLTQQT